MHADYKQTSLYFEKKVTLNLADPDPTDTTPATAATLAKPRPLVLPETFSGDGCFSEWIEHFESVAAVNSWDDAAKALWLRVQLTGKAQTAYKRLSDDAWRATRTRSRLCVKGSNPTASESCM